MDKDRELTPKSITESEVMEGLKRAGVEIEEAMRHLSQSHGVTLCQAWVLHRGKNENVVKLGGGYYDAAFKDYYESCVKIEDGCGGLALKALKTYEPYFSRNIITSLQTESSCCLAICLRNIYTGDFDYAFELFFSSYHNNPRVFLEIFFLKLKRWLPSFKFSSGAQIGHQLQVRDVENVTASLNIESLNILGHRKRVREEENRDGRVLQRSINNKSVNPLKRVSVEIQQALSILSDFHGLTLCQVWMYPYVNNKNEMCAMKLDGYCAPVFKDYYDACVKIQDGVLALKTLVSYQPYLSRDLHALLPTTTTATSSSLESTCCFAICLKNIYTGDLDYAFEFFFSLHNNNNNNFAFLDSLLKTLKSCFANFKLSYGAQLGPQLQILDADNLAAHIDFLALLNDGECEEAEEDCKNGTMRVRFNVLASVNFADLKIKISQRFHLVSNAYILYYLVKGPTRLAWIPLQGDQDLKTCIIYCTSNRITRLLIRVQPCTILNQIKDYPNEILHISNMLATTI